MIHHRAKFHQVATFDELPLGWGICQFSPDKIRYLRKHARYAHDMYEINLKTKCIKCEKTFGNTWSLSSHWKTIHTDNKYSYSCDSCDYITNRKDSLKDHKTIHHYKDYKFKCNECSYGTIRKHNLLNHQAIKHIHIKHSIRYNWAFKFRI